MILIHTVLLCNLAHHPKHYLVLFSALLQTLICQSSYLHQDIYFLVFMLFLGCVFPISTMLSIYLSIYLAMVFSLTRDKIMFVFVSLCMLACFLVCIFNMHLSWSLQYTIHNKIFPSMPIHYKVNSPTHNKSYHTPLSIFHNPFSIRFHNKLSLYKTDQALTRHKQNILQNTEHKNYAIIEKLSSQSSSLIDQFPIFIIHLCLFSFVLYRLLHSVKSDQASYTKCFIPKTRHSFYHSM